MELSIGSGKRSPLPGPLGRVAGLPKFPAAGPGLHGLHQFFSIYTIFLEDNFWPQIARGATRQSNSPEYSEGDGLSAALKAQH
jgi:hypothetical protein